MHSQKFLTNIKEVDIELLLSLDDADLFTVCQIDKYTTEICADDYFWNLRIQKVYKSNLSKYTSNKSYKAIYNQLRTRKGHSLFIYAVKQGYLPIVKYLIENKAESLLGANSDGEPILSLDLGLILASDIGHLEIIKYLIENGANIHAGLRGTDEALIKAVVSGDLEILKYLIENGANINAQHNAALNTASYEGRLDIVKYLIENGANIHGNNDSALVLASKRGHLEIVKYLTEKDSYNDDALIVAAKYGYFPIVKYLLENSMYNDINAAIESALDSEYIDIVDYLENYLEDSLEEM